MSENEQHSNVSFETFKRYIMNKFVSQSNSQNVTFGKTMIEDILPTIYEDFQQIVQNIKDYINLQDNYAINEKMFFHNQWKIEQYAKQYVTKIKFEIQKYINTSNALIIDLDYEKIEQIIAKIGKLRIYEIGFAFNEKSKAYEKFQEYVKQKQFNQIVKKPRSRRNTINQQIRNLEHNFKRIQINRC